MYGFVKRMRQHEAGRQIWVMSVQVNWDHVNLTLLNEAIYSGFWYFDCDENSEIVNANWSHEFRKMLGYHDTLDFPNKLESWSDLLHPQDKERSNWCSFRRQLRIRRTR